MNSINTMKIDSYGKTYDLLAEITEYVEGGLAIQLWCVENNKITEPFGMLTVYIIDYKTKDVCAYVDTNNMPSAINLISKYKLGESTGNFAFSGFCVYPEYRFDLDELNKYSIHQEGVSYEYI